jgi:murein DD-endopeptidase MepM/ murein hydrolase activator NlpD
MKKSEFRNILISGCATGIMLSLIFPFDGNNVNAATANNDTNISFIEEEDSYKYIDEPETIYSYYNHNFDFNTSFSKNANIGFTDLTPTGIENKILTNDLIVSKGDTIIKLMTNNGIPTNIAYGAFKKLSKVFNPKKLKIGQNVSISTIYNSDEDKIIDIDSFVIQTDPSHRYVLKNDSVDGLISFEEKDELITEINQARAEIKGSLLSSALDKDIPSSVIADFIKLFALNVDFSKDIRKGDKFEILYEKKYNPAGKYIKNGEILFASLDLRGQKINLYRYVDKKGFVDYYDENGASIRKSLDKKPLAKRNARISSPFGWRRHPIFKTMRKHWGVDYAAPRGTKVFAAGDGVVKVKKRKGAYGNYLRIRHNSNYSTAYAHLKGWAKGIYPGKRVKKGDVVAYVGNTGRSTGPHLHYEVIHNGKRINPRTIKVASGRILKGKELGKFKTAKNQITKTFNNMIASKQSSIKQLAMSNKTK